MPSDSPKPYRIAYLGWLGHDNMGDELGPVLFEQCLREHAPALADAEIVYDHARHPQCDATVACIGTLLTPQKYSEHWMVKFREASRRGPLVSVGLGVEPKDWTAWPTSDSFTRRLVGWWDLLGVRGKRSAAALGLGDADISGDSVFSLPWTTGIRPVVEDARPVVAVNVGDVVGPLNTPEGVRLAEIVARACGRLHDRFRFLLFSMGPRDDQPLEMVAAAIPGGPAGLVRVRDIHQIADALRHVSFGLTTKCHASGLLYAMGVPTVNLAYKAKCVDLATMVTTEDHILPLKGLDDAKVAERVEDMGRRWEPLRAALGTEVESVRRRWHAMFRRGMALIEEHRAGRYAHRGPAEIRRQNLRAVAEYPVAVLRRAGRMVKRKLGGRA